MAHLTKAPTAVMIVVHLFHPHKSFGMCYQSNEAKMFNLLWKAYGYIENEKLKTLNSDRRRLVGHGCMLSSPGPITWNKLDCEHMMYVVVKSALPCKIPFIVKIYLRKILKNKISHMGVKLICVPWAHVINKDDESLWCFKLPRKLCCS